ncbi:MAG: hypothetical protein KAU38_07555 [Desulfobacterales bacterium]|nr:hypothetical protein [Desulfobacterales bacterium]
MNRRIVQIADDLRKHFLESFLRRNDVSIFLCGGSSPHDAQFRRNLGTAIAATKSKYRYSVFYPEDMFVELILGHQRQDLLTLGTDFGQGNWSGNWGQTYTFDKK